MDFTRRDFIRAGAAAAVGEKLTPKPFFGLHPFIEANPKAVFIRRTHVAHKMDAPAKLREGLTLAREIFVPMDRAGVPVTHRIILKPNITTVRGRGPREDNWGTGTDAQFYEGLIAGLRELGLRKFHFAEANMYPLWNDHGYMDIHDRLGVKVNEPERYPRNFRDGDGMTWSKVPDGVIFTRIPHYAPVNEPDTWVMNVAKWKAHGMCMTQTVKNEQGMVVSPYQRFCQGWQMVLEPPDYMQPDIHPRAEETVKRFFERHIKTFSRYQSRAELSPIHQEIWAHKTCDNMSALTRTGLAMVEGIYGRNGDGFGYGKDIMANVVMFGKDRFRVDLVGLYLSGHEPGNVHLYRIAKERGLSDTFNPWEVPVYEWKEGRGVPRKLSDFERTPLETYYLRKDGEPAYHLVNEPFDYDRVRT
ncbi:MAG TPA: DUF362 domain-containing protein [Bryobacteraceae bacterium]|nr:DUF362 domain-containing protein [Bryobacteraceae bacterium]